MRYIYILRCADTTLYTGITTDITRRLEEHNTTDLGAKYTRSRRPLKLVRHQAALTRSLASKGERQIKQLSRKDKQQLISSGAQLPL